MLPPKTKIKIPPQNCLRRISSHPARPQINKMSNVGGAAPTGCYKCGRPGHWSRDCPSDPNPSEANNNNAPIPPNSDFNSNRSWKPPIPNQKGKQKAPRKTRPKLTPDLLLSDSGIGYILRYFPRAFKCRGRGHEVRCLNYCSTSLPH